ncbi:hypothetical protein V6N13_147942 [Hibiscus sabdariffa]
MGPLVARRLSDRRFRVGARLDWWRSFLVLFMAPSPLRFVFSTIILSGCSRMLGCGVSFLQSLSFGESSSIEACFGEKISSFIGHLVSSFCRQCLYGSWNQQWCSRCSRQTPVFGFEVDPSVRHPFTTLKLRLYYYARSIWSYLSLSHDLPGFGWPIDVGGGIRILLDGA